MTKSFFALLMAQFLSAFADNAVLFTIISIVIHSPDNPQWYVPALQSVFLIAFVVLAPWSGYVADRFAKSQVLLLANFVKAFGGVLLLCEVEPLLAYGIVGVGAAIYSPAKYGILPELVESDNLVKANSWIEGSTILAILLGMIIGAKVADVSTNIALGGAVSLFLFSALIACYLPKYRCDYLTDVRPSLSEFYRQIGHFFMQPLAYVVIFSGALFWAVAATLRVILVGWAPVVLKLNTASDIAQLTLFLAIGIIIGSSVVSKLISLKSLSRVGFAAYGMALSIISLSFTDVMLYAQLILLLTGIMGGVFIVPINAALQNIGVNNIGTGHAVAIQGFFQNVAMLFALSIYSYAVAQSLSPIAAMLSLGIVFFVAVLALTLYHFYVNKPIYKQHL